MATVTIALEYDKYKSPSVRTMVIRLGAVIMGRRRSVVVQASAALKLMLCARMLTPAHEALLFFFCNSNIPLSEALLLFSQEGHQHNTMTIPRS